MEMNTLILGDCLTEIDNIQDGIVDLVIADPPYFKVISEGWDYQWRTIDDYLQWSLEWLAKASRTLRVGGTMYLFGYYRTVSLLAQSLEGIGLVLRQQIIIDKGMKAVAGRATKKYRMFPNVTESIFMLFKDNKPFLRNLLREAKERTGLTSREINEKLGVKSNGGGMWSIYAGNNVCAQFPTIEVWEKLSAIFGFDIEYSKVAQTFNPQMGLTDVWNDIDFYSERRFHPTQKPLKLRDRLIFASSNEGDVVLDPFMGSGNAILSAKANGRRYIGIEKDKKYYDIAYNRVENE